MRFCIAFNDNIIRYINFLCLLQIHEGEYICRVDNGYAGPDQERIVMLHLQGEGTLNI